MENFFDVLDIEMPFGHVLNDAQISEFLQVSCEDSHLMGFMFERNPIDAQMIGGNDALYTVKSEVTNVNKKYKHMEKKSNLKRQVVN